METTILLGDYKKMSYEEVVKHIVDNFYVERQIVDNYYIILANSHLYDYEEDAFFVLLGKTDGKLYIVQASHCSCYGFEEQFEPDETGIEYLLSDKCYFGGYCSDEDRERIQNRFVLMTRYMKLEQLKERMG